MTRPFARTLLAALLLAAASASAANAKAPKPLFANADIIDITIKAPVQTLPQVMPPPTAGRVVRPSTAPPPEPVIAGTLAVAGASPETLAVRISPRGITRRKRDVCIFPPLRIEFPTKPPPGSLFQGQKRLKLVTHCRRDESHQQHLLLEYAAYRLYNAITPASFAVRLAQIDYVDEKGEPITRRLGVFIEDVDDMARRQDLAESKAPDRIAISQLDPAAAARVALFQYMIGNLDWAMNAGPAGEGCCHNARLIGVKGATTGLLPVPYDFDYSGLVDAPYAVSPRAIQSGSVRMRRYRGFCTHNADVPAAAAAILAQRASLVAVIGTVPGLDPGTRKKAGAYLEGFFAQLESPSEIETRLLKTCV
jgi:hypothetical protein